ncbi:DNA helicase IV [Providencia vermicola]|uniref:DNA 3'-5' helicase n=1 Tax=Providencia stuartii TaxID=588 RepID=A0ABD5L6I6_PROST|nr:MULTISPECIES: DNA helicase IV [Providencia]ELR5043211.1 DNA helicase IV [Providencia rettgeri]ELR5120567.1 DNA helicase IV [Providencia stuartii]ELR5143101.1 DNA helicase IV [Providencia stuartii]ELR5291839.1 DNA helicase IV [Providencia stuartii]MCR4179608.1 DNA helicase IV [Providencia vermicola]
MELKSTQIGQRLAQHPYNRVRLLNAGIEVSGEKHQYLIPFNQLIDIHCKRGIVWGELEFELSDEQVVRLHGTEWKQTQRFYHYLNDKWQQWSLEMSEISAEVLTSLAKSIQQQTQQDSWLNLRELASFRKKISEKFSSLPLPLARVSQFENCAAAYRYCLQWLEDGERCRQHINQQWSESILSRYGDFFQHVETSPLNPSQSLAVINGEENILVLAGAGSGKTSVLVARAGWLLLRGLAKPEQILLLAFGRKAAQEMNERIHERLQQEDIEAKTFHALALQIIREGSNKSPVISELEINSQKRSELLLNEWREQCSSKKAQAKGWREWLTDELQWDVPEGEFWQDEKISKRVVTRLDRWLSLMRMHGGSQKEMIEAADEQQQSLFQKRIRLMSPLLKAWKSALKEEGAIDFSGLIHQAINLLEKGRFISPWKHILVDEFQDISPLRAKLLQALRQQNKQTSLFAVGDDWQAIYRFSGAELDLTTSFEQNFGQGALCALDTTYRFNERIGEIANRFILQNPTQLDKPLNSLVKGSKKSVILLDENALERLLDKMSGYVTDNETILCLARYHYLRPEILNKAKTRWPKLNIEFMTIHASKGKQADHVIICGLNSGKDSFPAVARESIMEQVLLPKHEEFEYAEERRLLYVAMTRAKQQVWLLYHPDEPSEFVDILKQLGVPKQKKP